MLSMVVGVELKPVSQWVRSWASCAVWWPGWPPWWVWCYAVLASSRTGSVWPARASGCALGVYWPTSRPVSTPSSSPSSSRCWPSVAVRTAVTVTPWAVCPRTALMPGVVWSSKWDGSKASPISAVEEDLLTNSRTIAKRLWLPLCCSSKHIHTTYMY